MQYTINFSREPELLLVSKPPARARAQPEKWTLPRFGHRLCPKKLGLPQAASGFWQLWALHWTREYCDLGHCGESRLRAHQAVSRRQHGLAELRLVRIQQGSTFRCSMPCDELAWFLGHSWAPQAHQMAACEAHLISESSVNPPSFASWLGDCCPSAPRCEQR